MITSFILAFALISLSVALIATLEPSTRLVISLFRSLLRLTHRSKLLTEYILRAYLRYRRTIQKTQFRPL